MISREDDTISREGRTFREIARFREMIIVGCTRNEQNMSPISEHGTKFGLNFIRDESD